MLEECIVPSEEQMQAMRDRARDEVIERCRGLYGEYADRLEKGKIDIVFFDVSPMEKFAGVAVRGIVDKYRQVYVSIVIYVGVGIGSIGIGTTKLFKNALNTLNKNAFVKCIAGESWGISLYGIFGGGFSWGEAGASVDLGVSATVAINGCRAYTWKIYEF